MQLESAKYLEDIRQAGRTVVEGTAARTLDDYLGDKLLRLAVERCFEIIGEAPRRLDEHDHATASGITDFKRIIGFRNVLIHGYSIVNHERVWRIVQDDLPRLLGEVEALLAAPPVDPPEP
jgi:uncharacterized protein with HEPN domain